MSLGHGRVGCERLNDVALCLHDMRGSATERVRTTAVDVYAYFNNDVGGHAPRDAVALRRLLETSAC